MGTVPTTWKEGWEHSPLFGEKGFVISRVAQTIPPRGLCTERRGERGSFRSHPDKGTDRGTGDTPGFSCTSTLLSQALFL